MLNPLSWSRGHRASRTQIQPTMFDTKLGARTNWQRRTSIILWRISEFRAPKRRLKADKTHLHEEIV